MLRTSRTPTGDPIMVARFAVPALPATYVRRSRLVRRLAEGAQGPLVLVTGPAGAGKTLQVADWFRSEQGGGRAAWLTVEASDNEPVLFWAYVLEALQHHGVPLPEEISALGEGGQVDPALLGRLAAHLHERDEPVLLVLDEFEQIGSPEIATGLHELLRHSAGGLRLVLVSRIEPLLPLHRYRLTDDLTCVRAADLMFSPDEAGELFAAHGLGVSQESIRGITVWTGGWAAGLRLAALAAQEAPDPEACLRDFEAGPSTIADFLTDEVFVTQSAETQDLLLRTCVLDQIHPDLADALTARRDGSRILDHLHRSNAFVAPVGHSWYRYHPLFAEILRSRLRAWQPGLERELHTRAARWLAQHGQVLPALTHAAAAEDWELACGLLVRTLAVGRLLAGSEAARLGRLFADMPEETAGPAPELVRAGVALARQEPDRAARHLDQAEQHFPEADGTEASTLRFTSACLRVFAARLNGSVPAAEAAAAEAAERRAELPQGLVDQHPELSFRLLGDLGAVLLRDGRFEEAGRALAAAAEAPHAPETAQPRQESLGRLGLIEVLDGRLDQAQAHARAAMAEAERSGLGPGEGSGAERLVLAEVAIERGQLEAADAELRRADRAVAECPDEVVAHELSMARSRLLLAKGEPEAALNALRQGGPALQDCPELPWLSDRFAAATSAAHLAAGNPEAAIDVLRDADVQAPEPGVAAARARLALGEPETALRTLDDLDPRGVDGSVADVQALLARAEAADALGDPAAARRLVRRALVVSDPERLWLPFRLTAHWLRRVLNAEPGLARPYAWLPSDLRADLRGADPRATAGTGSAGGGTAELPVIVESLSDREQEVLARVAELLSTEEIAIQLHLSVNTVKTHLKSINRKLAVSRRGEAVRRARELDLL